MPTPHPAADGTIASTPHPLRRARPWWLALVGAFLVTDVVLIALDLTLGADASWPEVLHVYHEQGLPEWLMYGKWLVAAATMAWLALGRHVTYVVWALAFGYLALDDALSIHERVAGRLGQWFPFDQWLGLPFQAWVILEPLYMVAVGVALMVVLFIAQRREPDRTSQRYSIEALVLLAIFVGFAGVGDVIGRVGFGGTHLPEVLEDAGEMVVATVILAHAVRHAVTVAARRDV